jgi:REP element-mobilizing transposase RayT
MKQLNLLRTHGGAREGAGRPRGTKASHRARPRLSRHHPVHVILRTGITNLRSGPAFGIVRRCLQRCCEREGFRLVHFSVQSNHIHLLVEADDEKCLARGMQGLAISIAKSLNSAVAREGRVFEDHYFAVQMKSPAQTRHTLRYVLRNFEHHTGRPLKAADPRVSQQPLTQPRTRLLRIGWRVVRSQAPPPVD